MLKRISTLIITCALIWGGLALPALAINTTSGLADAGSTSGFSTSQNILTLIGAIVTVVLSILGVIFLCLTVYAGMIWMTAAGEEKKTQKAKDILQAAVIGIVITVSAYAISLFVMNMLMNVIYPTGNDTGSEAWGDSPWGAIP